MSRASRVRRIVEEQAAEVQERPEPTMRVVLFDEDGPHDLGSQSVVGVHDTLASVFGEDVPESVAVAMAEDPVLPDAVAAAWSSVETESDEHRSAPIVPSLAEMVEQAEVEHQADLDVRATLPAPRDPVPRMDQSRLEMRIRRVGQWLVQNPKRPGTVAWANFNLYVDGMTVSAYLASHDRRRARTDLAWDIQHGFVRLETQAEWAASQAEDEAALAAEAAQ